MRHTFRAVFVLCIFSLAFSACSGVSPNLIRDWFSTGLKFGQCAASVALPEAPSTSGDAGAGDASGE